MESQLFLKENPSLKDLQEYVREMKAERSLNVTDPTLDCMLLAEECGEVISAVRKHMKGGSIGTGSVAGDVELEMADVLIILMGLANMHGIDLEQALRKKEEINKQRTWKRI